MSINIYSFTVLSVCIFYEVKNYSNFHIFTFLIHNHKSRQVLVDEGMAVLCTSAC